MSGAFLGPRVAEDEIQVFLDANGVAARRVDRASLADHIARLLAESWREEFVLD